MVLATLKVGSPAPPFVLPCTPSGLHRSRRASLEDYKGRWLALVFYPRDFSLVCPTELTALSARIEEFHRRGCEILGVSTDPVAVHEQWLASPRSQGGLGGLSYPLASDESGDVCRAYGVLVEVQHIALRGLFVIDPNGILQYAAIHNMSVGRRTDEVLRMLDALQSGGLCPENWTFGSPPIDTSLALVPGSVMSHFRIEKRLGSGSFATVYKARDLSLQRDVALKVIQPGKLTSPAEVLAEARAAAALTHPNICTVYSVDDSEGVPLIVMELVAGRAISEFLRSGPASVRRTTAIGRQIADAIAAAHASAVVHGDLKPENILLTEDSNVKITDFGLARREPVTAATAETMSWDEVKSGIISGTPAYMAPELIEGQRVTSASDVFALAVIFHEMLTGRKVFAAGSMLEVFHKIRTFDPGQLAREVPSPFSEILARALARSPAERPSMREISQLLAAG